MKNKNMTLVLALLLIVGLSFGYVSYSTRVNQSSTSKEVGKWDVEITNVEITTNGDAMDKNYEFKEGTLVLRPILSTVDDYVSYKVTIKNKGTIPAKLGRYIYNEKNKEEHLVFTHNAPKEELGPNEETVVELFVYPSDKTFEDGKSYTNDFTAIYEYIEKR